MCMAASRIGLMHLFDSYYVISLDSIGAEATCMCSRAHSRRSRASYLPRSLNLTRSCQVPMVNLGHMQLDRATVQQSLGAQMQEACRWEMLHTTRQYLRAQAPWAAPTCVPCQPAWCACLHILHTYILEDSRQQGCNSDLSCMAVLPPEAAQLEMCTCWRWSCCYLRYYRRRWCARGSSGGASPDGVWGCKGSRSAVMAGRASAGSVHVSREVLAKLAGIDGPLNLLLHLGTAGT